MRVTVDQLVVDAPGHIGQREPALLGGQRGVEVDLEQQVAQLLLQVSNRRRAAVQPFDGLDHLVGLFDGVAGQALVGLLPVPRAALPQGADQLGEPDQLGPDRHGQRGHVQRGQMVGLDRPVEVVPSHLDHRLVGQP